MKNFLLHTLIVLIIPSFSSISQAATVLEAEWDDVVFGRCSDQSAG